MSNSQSESYTPYYFNLIQTDANIFFFFRFSVFF